MLLLATGYFPRCRPLGVALAHGAWLQPAPASMSLWSRAANCTVGYSHQSNSCLRSALYSSQGQQTRDGFSFWQRTRQPLVRRITSHGVAADIRQAHIAAAPRVALQKTFNVRARNLPSSGAELPSKQSLDEIEETLGWVRERHSVADELISQACVHPCAYKAHVHAQTHLPQPVAAAPSTGAQLSLSPRRLRQPGMAG